MQNSIQTKLGWECSKRPLLMCLFDVKFWSWNWCRSQQIDKYTSSAALSYNFKKRSLSLYGLLMPLNIKALVPVIEFCTKWFFGVKNILRWQFFNQPHDHSLWIMRNNIFYVRIKKIESWDFEIQRIYSTKGFLDVKKSSAEANNFNQSHGHSFSIFKY